VERKRAQNEAWSVVSRKAQNGEPRKLGLIFTETYMHTNITNGMQNKLFIMLETITNRFNADWATLINIDVFSSRKLSQHYTR